MTNEFTDCQHINGATTHTPHQRQVIKLILHDIMHSQQWHNDHHVWNHATTLYT